MICFAITVSTEYQELEDLLTRLLDNVLEDDEILIQCDQTNVTSQVRDVIQSFLPQFADTTINVIEFPLNRDFATFKNNIFKHTAQEWIFQIDADELPTLDLLENLHEIIEINREEYQVIALPRINTVQGITLNHVNKWGWNISKLDDQITIGGVEDNYSLLVQNNLITESHGEGENRYLVYYTPIINFPDYQLRLYKNDGSVAWSKNVHETISSAQPSVSLSIGVLPPESSWCLLHHKTIQRQEAQNNFYSNLLVV